MKTVLIIENEKPLREVLARKLRDENYNVIETTNGQEGYNKALSEKPDLILLDLIMPVMSGSELLQRLREDEWGKDVPVTVLTNLSGTEEVKKAVEHNADLYVKSDWRLEDIVEQIKKKIGS